MLCDLSVTDEGSFKKGYGDFYAVTPENFSMTPKISFAYDTINLKFSFITDIVSFLKSYTVVKDTTIANKSNYTIKISVKASQMRITYIRDATLYFSFPSLSADYYKIEFEKGENNVRFDLSDKSFFVISEK